MAAAFLGGSRKIPVRGPWDRESLRAQSLGSHPKKTRKRAVVIDDDNRVGSRNSFFSSKQINHTVTAASSCLAFLGRLVLQAAWAIRQQDSMCDQLGTVTGCSL